MATDAIERRGLQVAFAAAGLVPVSAGLAGGLYGSTAFGQMVAIGLDSHIRYLSGLLLGIGLIYWSAIPGVEKEGGRIGVLTLIVVIGGFCRALGMLVYGPAGAPAVAALAMELIVAPGLYLWQRRLAHRAAMDVVAPWR